jgi:hypothetical protein
MEAGMHRVKSIWVMRANFSRKRPIPTQNNAFSAAPTHGLPHSMADGPLLALTVGRFFWQSEQH